MTDKTLRDLIGSRVYYQKQEPATRNGWTGTIVNVYSGPGGCKAAVLWDGLDEETTYCAEAIGFNRPGTRYHGPAPGAVHPQYIYFDDRDAGTSPDDGPLYLVTGENGGPVHRVHGRDNADRLARRKAGESRSGQRYVVFRAFRVYERQDPPVKVTPATHDDC